MYGLGYDKSTDAYKIVRIVHILKPKVNRRLEFTARTYNCKTKCWKRINDFFPYKIFKNAQGVILNGVPHWIVAREHNEKENVIIYFDVVDDTIVEIDTPLPCTLGADFTFSNFDGSLCLVTTTERFSKVWVLKEEGMTKSWEKLYKFKKDMDPFRYTIKNEFWFHIDIDNIVPLCRRNKAILFAIRLKDYFYPNMTASACPLRLLTYDPESKEQHKIILIRQTVDNVFNSITCVESLVSP